MMPNREEVHEMKSYVVDAFTDTVFKGNPAAVCVTEQWLPEELMQQIASENNLSETAFVVKEGDCYGLRWFTPSSEIDLCGHATLASAYIIMRFFEPQSKCVSFQTKSGVLKVEEKQDLYEMDMPAYHLTQVEVTEAMAHTIGAPVEEAWMARDLVCVLADEELVRSAAPEETRVKELDGLLLHITAQGSECDCVTRNQDDSPGRSTHFPLSPSNRLLRTSMVSRAV